MPKELNSGHMPDTDFRYEEFEGLLGSYYLSLLPLQEGDEKDKGHFQQAVDALNGLARSQRVQLPAIALANPRPTEAEWGHAKAFSSPTMLLDSFRSFYSDFGVGTKPRTRDFVLRLTLAQTVLRVLERRGAIEAQYDMVNGEKTVPNGVKEYDRELSFKPLSEILSTAA